jgi:hypothetical protein
VSHNITGLMGVMEGASSDLRTGLPKQMIEIHEPMRLQVLVEAELEVLTAIYERQPPLQALIGKGWLLLAAKAPESAAIHLFDPERGWQPWQDSARPPAQVARWSDCYQGRMGPLKPVLLQMEGDYV